MHLGDASICLSCLPLTVKLQADKKSFLSQCPGLKHSPDGAGDAGGGGGEDVRFRCTLSGLRLEATAELR